MAKLEQLRDLLSYERLPRRKTDNELREQGARAYMMIIEKVDNPYNKSSETRSWELWNDGWYKRQQKWIADQTRAARRDREAVYQ